MPGPTVKRGSTSDDVYRRLRDLIVEGVYQSGERLTQAQLMRMLNAGRTPLREALSRLQSDGLVVVSPNRGATVAPVRLGSAEEVYVMRLLVEPPLLEARAEHVSADQLRRMWDLLGRMEDKAAEPAAFVRAHREFHSVERAHYTTAVIDEVVMQMYRQIHRYQQHFRTREADPRDFIRLDREALTAIVDGDGRRARQALEFHLVDAALSLLLGEDPEHSLSLLAPVAAAAGILLDVSEDGPARRPVRISWRDPAPALPAFETANLVYRPG